MNSPYLPERGDVIWLDFNPQTGHEQMGRRPALVISPQKYNKIVGLVLVCPITQQAKGYPFEVKLPNSTQIQGVVIADQIKSLDWQGRNATYIEEVPQSVVLETINKLNSLLRI